MKSINAARLPSGQTVFVIRDNGVVRGQIVAPPTIILKEAFVHVRVPGAIETVNAGRIFLTDSDARTAFNILAGHRPG